jgi:hypothetical protein
MRDFKLPPQSKLGLRSSGMFAAVQLFNCLLITNVRAHLAVLAHSIFLTNYSSSIADAKVTNKMQCQLTSTLQTTSNLITLCLLKHYSYFILSNFNV